MDSLAQRQTFLDQPAHSAAEQDPSWRKYRVLLGKPGTGKSQVLIRAIHEALQREASVLLAAQEALLAQGYRSIFFGADLECDTLHTAFCIPVQPGQASDVNFPLDRFDMVVVDEASFVSPASFNIMAGTLNRLNCRPVVVITGDSRQQQPLQTVEGRVCNTVSIVNDETFSQENAIKHSLYQQFRIVDKEYKAFVDMVRYLQPTQRQLDQFQEDLVLCTAGCLADEDIYRAFSRQAHTTIMTVSRPLLSRSTASWWNSSLPARSLLAMFPAPNWLAVHPSYLTQACLSSSQRTVTRPPGSSTARTLPWYLCRVPL